jgi:hypothetical protein
MFPNPQLPTIEELAEKWGQEQGNSPRAFVCQRGTPGPGGLTSGNSALVVSLDRPQPRQLFGLAAVFRSPLVTFQTLQIRA